jgi:hypothetical protein
MRRIAPHLFRGIAVALLVAACSATKDFDDPSDPLGDHFFSRGMESDSLDEVMHGQSPSVGWLANEDLYDQERVTESDGENELVRRERAAAGAGEVVEAERRSDPWARDGDDSDASDPGRGISKREKTFGEKAQEATLATMSVLIGAGMAALPYLLGT